MSGILDEMTKSPEFVFASMKIIAAGNEFKERLLLQLRDQLESMAMNKGWMLNWQLSTQACSGVDIEFSEEDAFVFRVASDAGDYSNFYYGTFQKEGRADDGSILATLSEQIATGQRYPTPNAWSWCRRMRRNDALLPFERDWRGSPQPWSAIADGTLANAIMKAAEEVRRRISHNRGKRALGENEKR